MPSPKNGTRKPRSRPNAGVPGNPSLNSMAMIQEVIAGQTPNDGGLSYIILVFQKPLPGDPTADSYLTLKDTANASLTVDSWGWGYDPVTVEPNQRNVLWIAYNNSANNVASFMYQPAGLNVGDTDSSGIPIKVRFDVTLQIPNMNE